MTETCTCDCDCDSDETETAKIPNNIPLEEEIREYVLSEIGEQDYETILKRVEITPEEFEVCYRTYD